MDWFVYKILHLFKKVLKIYLLFVKTKSRVGYLQFFLNYNKVKLPNADIKSLCGSSAAAV